MPTEPENINQLTDHLFRHEAGKMVAVLTKIFGTENLELAEDVVQDTLLQAMLVWQKTGIPDNPAGWLYRVAKNKAIDVLRRNKHSVQFDFSDTEKIPLTSSYSISATMDEFWKEELINDDVLRMMFTCCHPDIADEAQVTLILKTLCGFSTAEIAKSFLTNEETISKRLYRTKEFFRQHKIKPAIPSTGQLQARTYAVLNSVYLLFNEGYNSTHSEELIRRDLIEEALRLCKLLTENAHTQISETFALMALMCFHASRTEGRLTTSGEIILLPKQNRSQWNAELIAAGNFYMNKAAFGSTISTYHLEAAIAYEHCTAESFDKTNWHKILDYYDWLCKIAPSPVSELNRVVAIMQLNGPLAALKASDEIAEKKKLASFYLYQSLLGEIHTRLHNTTLAKECFEKAIEQTRSEAEKKMLRDKISALLN